MEVVGQIDEIVEKKSNNNKSYSIVKIGGSSHWDWKGFSKNFNTGEWTSMQVQPGEYPRITKMEHTEAPGVQQELKPEVSAEINKVYAPKNGNLANSPEYLACKLAVELVGNEQIDHEQKMARFHKAYKEIKELLK